MRAIFSYDFRRVTTNAHKSGHKKFYFFPAEKKVDEEIIRMQCGMDIYFFILVLITLNQTFQLQKSQ